MTRYTGTWDADEVAAYLDDARVPVRLACRTPSGRLWMLSLWYRFRDGTLQCSTAASADVVEYLRADDDVAFEVSTNDPPYRGVRGNGVASVAPDPGKELLRALIARYLGDAESDLARWLLRDDREEVRIRIEPETVYSWDYTDRMRDVADHGD